MRRIECFVLAMLLLGSATLFAEKKVSKGNPGLTMPLVLVNKAAMVQREDVRRYTGRIVSPATVLVVTRVSGEIIEVGFKEGDYVKKGQMLYKLDPVQYYAALKACEARVNQGKAKIDECLAKELYCKNNYDRNWALFQKTVVSKDTVESIKSAMDVAAAATAAARSSMAEAEADLIAAKDNYKNTTIVAPMAGRIGVTNKTVGNYITPATGTLATLIQTDPMRVRFAISYREFLEFLGTDGVLELPVIRIRMSNGEFYAQDGTLEFVNNEANQGTDSIQLYARFQNKSSQLYQGGTVSVYLRFISKEKKLAVYPSSVMHDSAGAYIYVIGADGKVQRREVKLGLATTKWQFIEDGLKVGETVIRDGMQKVFPGMSVETTETDAVKL